MAKNTHEEFKKVIWEYYHKNKRNFPWRQTTDQYQILVSEIMLQQTQTDRVVPKFNDFIKKFSTFQALAKASLPDVLQLWSGLGYNRRALYLQKTAQAVVTQFGNTLPSEEKILMSLPGIGKYTAGALMAFAFNKRAIFIETNIRRVFIHFFFSDKEKISDAQLIPYIEQTLPENNYREWYYALMDYGNYLAKITHNPNRKSKHYTKQSKFEGSKRQLRGAILREYLAQGSVTEDNLMFADYTKEYIGSVIQDLKKEGLID
ncbi:MAG TPA: A/G-specific adenine glycosylase [Candidatus Levybacteria bacterium]|nr:A/G-specific adenine glycosylase [Candidatus Levybacteria bacterium]